jgi:hypothetical protein
VPDCGEWKAGVGTHDDMVGRAAPAEFKKLEVEFGRREEPRVNVALPLCVKGND